MLFPLSWLKEFIDLPEAPETIAEIFNEVGLEVDAFEKMHLKFSGIFVGKVLNTEKHPEADSLKIATVFDGNDKHQVICGDPTCKEGLTVAFAKTGAVLEDADGKPFKIKKAKLRGVESFGMLCSEEELGFSEKSDGILSLPEETPLGTPLEDLFNDTIFEISLTPNLAHCFCIIGIARELSAYLKRSLKPSAFPKASLNMEKTSAFTLTVADKESCPIYTGTVIENVSVKPSPLCLKQRLIACGMRPINNVVDLTNALMMAYGQPMHAFDADKIAGNKIEVRRSQKGEVCKTLDGATHTLPKDILVITDAKGPNAIAGVMGGADSEVTESTKNIFLESAHFLPKIARFGSTKLNISTESSKRFERGVDPKIPLNVAHLASSEIIKLAGGIACKTLIEESPLKKPSQICCRIARIETVIGHKIPEEEIESIFTYLNCELEKTENTYLITPPSYRFDINIEEDLIEEVARFYGYSKLPRKAPKYQTGSLPHDPMYLFEGKLRKSLLLSGLQEIMNIDLISETEQISLLSTPLGKPFPKLANPGSSDQSALRSSLLGGTLTTLKRNLSFHNTNFQSFEIGKVYYQNESDPSIIEKTHVSILLTGLKHPAFWGNEKPATLDFFDLKGILENLFGKFNIKSPLFKKDQLEAFHPGQCASISSDDKVFGYIGKLHPKLTHALDLSKDIYYAELNLDLLLSLSHGKLAFKSLAGFPSSWRDWTLPIKKETEAGVIFQTLSSIKHKLLESVELLTIYEDASIGKQQKNISFRFTYRDPKKTLSLEGIEKTHQYVIKQAEKALASYILS